MSFASYASWRRACAVGLTVALTVSLAGTVDRAVDAAAADPFPTWSKPPRVSSVPGHEASAGPARPDRPDPASAAAVRDLPTPDWPATDTGEAILSAATPPAGDRAGQLPVWIGPAKGRRSAAPDSVDVTVLSQRAAERAGVPGLLMRLRRSDGVTRPGPVTVTVDYSAFRYAYGGDWAARLRLIDLESGDLLPTENDLADGRVTAGTELTSTATTLALTSTEGGSAGDYEATSLAPSGTWQVALNSGNFTWSHPMTTPPVPGELTPSIAASYSSGAVDGRTASTNNQPSWVGEGWSLWPGFIERSYKSCADDTASGSPKTGDLCWGTQNATMSFGGSSTPLVYDNGGWRPKDDDGTRVERLTGAANGDGGSGAAPAGEYWRITTTDGTQYYFGRHRLPSWASGDPVTNSTWSVPVFGNDDGEPCHAATFAASYCTQAYRWNLDYVVDTHGNSLSYFYAPETNKYGLNRATKTASYTRGGTLLRAEYGTRTGQEYAGPAPARVVFASADRCKPGTDCTSHTGASWPDVPWDRACSGTTCPTQYSPSFWSTKRLATVTTQIHDGSGYRDVDEWTFNQTYPDPGDGTSAGLWLHGITQTGRVGGSLALPEVTFAGAAMANRVNSASDGLPKLNKYRIDAVYNESGGVVDVVYKQPNCSPGALPAAGTNPLRCFPVRWAMSPEPEPRDDWFHKYVVGQISRIDRVGGGATEVTRYDYVGDAAWHYVDDPLIPVDVRTWSDWRGYGKVVVHHGDPAEDPHRPVSESTFQYLRGMDGDRKPGGGTKSVRVTDSTGVSLTDSEPLAGFLREEITRDGVGGPVVTSTIHQPWTRGPTASQSWVKAYQVEETGTTTRTALSSGGFRTTQVDTTFDEFGNPTEINDRGDLAVASDDQCTTTDYARNTDTLLVDLPSRVTTVGVACGESATFPADAIADVRAYYDNLPLDAPPTVGNPTKVEEVDSYAGGTPAYVTTSRTSYDGYGRVLDAYDALDRKTETRYQPALGPVTTTTVTNPLGHAVTTTLDPRRGQPVSVVDVNDRRTDLTYDPLGRLTHVWLPGRSKAAGQTANTIHAYEVRTTGPSWVKTTTLKPNGNHATGYALLDGFLRPRQTQAPSPRGGRVLTDTIYDSRGLTWQVRQPYYNADSEPSTTLFVPVDKNIPNTTLTTYDGAERPTASYYMKFNEPQWHTTTAYGGDHVDVTPPAGETATSTYVDARGRITELRQYHATTPSGDYDATRYRYTKAGGLAKVIDPAGNAWTFDYDVRGRRITADDPDNGRTSMTYDDAGQLLTTSDARGQTIALVYDELGRQTERRADSATGPLLAEWTYDTLSKGDLTSSTRYVDGEAYTRAVTGYDDAGRPTGETITIPDAEGALAGTYTTTTTYKPDGSPATVRLPRLGDLAPETLVYGYDGLGLQTTLDGWATYVRGTDYTAYGEPYQRELGSYGKRVQQTYWYDEGTRRLTRAVNLTEMSSTADQRRYAYDPAGNVTSVTQAQSGVATDTQCFHYDHLRRLTEAWTQSGACDAEPSTAAVGGPAPYWSSYRYDQTGNRTRHVQHGLAGAADTVSTSTYPAAGSARPHAVQSVRTTGPDGTRDAFFGYDATGNTTRRPGPRGAQSLTWDVDGSLTSVTAGDQRTRYVYGADGQQLIRRDPGSVTLYLGSGELTVDTTTGAKRGTRYYGAGGATAVRTGAGLSWLVADQHNTAEVAIDQSTQRMTTRRFDPFGNPRGTSVSWPGGQRGFVGGTANDATGLTRLGAREYDPELGRFLSVDPLMDPSDPQQMNGYAYASNNPTTFTDPTGLRTWEGDDGRWTDSHAVGSPAPPPAPAPATSHPAQDFGGGCPTGQKSWCQAVRNRADSARRARNHDPGAKVDPNAYDPDWYILPNGAKVSVSYACAVETGLYYGTSRCSDIQVALAEAQLKRLGERDHPVAEFLYELTPIADGQHCLEGDWLSCLALIPGGKAVKLAAKGVDAAKKANKGADDVAPKGRTDQPESLDNALPKGLDEGEDSRGWRRIMESAGVAEKTSKTVQEVAHEINHLPRGYNAAQTGVDLGIGVATTVVIVLGGRGIRGAIGVAGAEVRRFNALIEAFLYWSR